MVYRGDNYLMKTMLVNAADQLLEKFGVGDSEIRLELDEENVSENLRVEEQGKLLVEPN